MESDGGSFETVPGCNRALHVRKRRHASFGKERRRTFLEHLAATCNVTASADAAGVSHSCVYANRMKDPGFRADWALALEQGYARLEMALLERTFGGASRIAIDGDLEISGPNAPNEIDWDKGMELMKHHARALAGRTTDNKARPKRVPIEQVAAKLIRKMKALGVSISDQSGASTGDGGTGRAGDHADLPRQSGGSTKDGAA